ncbi:hypothetical protein [Flavihumibacter profundi]|uniref:hypothetical protein n=1 Tax=Flavihumibacter profundi TaxID=2716883 RepID=UPI001CC463C3|nr:hypothetical protein [Flavihumibacter profundi]MBZ5856851.1 hypothetical protein [Flavihumibacter profundi]
MKIKSVRQYCLLFILATIFVPVACNKNHDTPKTKTALLTAGPWIMTGEMFHGDTFTTDGSIADRNLFPLESACVKDDITTFYTNGTAQKYAGAIVCPGTTGLFYDFKWEFRENESILNCWGYNFYNVEVTETSLKYVIRDPYATGSTINTITVTFSH